MLLRHFLNSQNKRWFVDLINEFILEDTELLLGKGRAKIANLIFFGLTAWMPIINDNHDDAANCQVADTAAKALNGRLGMGDQLFVATGKVTQIEDCPRHLNHWGQNAGDLLVAAIK